MIAIGALGLALIAGTAYKFLHEPDKPDEKTTKVEDVGVKDQNPTDQQKPNGPVIPAAPPEETAGDQPSPEPPGSGTMVARLLSAIDTRTATQGDTFTAKLEDGPYSGGILTGTIRKLKKSRKNLDLELEFNKLNGKAIPVGLDLVDIANAHGVKGVDDENNKITGDSSKKKVPLVTAGTAALGAVIGAIKGSKKGAVIGGAAGSGAGYLVSMTLVTRSQDVDLQPGSRITLRENNR